MNSSEQVLTLHGTTMPYITFGTGEKAFVIITGMSMAGIRGLSFSVAHAYAAFAEEYSVFVFDRIDNLPEGYSTADMAEDVACAMQQLNLQNADVLGVSQGGMIAQLLAARHPELVHSLVLGSTMCSQNDMERSVIGYWLELAERREIPALNRSFFQKVYSPAFQEKNKQAIAYLENVGDESQCARLSVLARAALCFDSTADLSRITCPVLVIGDRNDQVLSGAASEELAQKLNCPLFLYDSYGHAVYDEAPDYKQRLLDFFHSIP